MFILKFFGSIIILFVLLGIIFVVLSFIIAQSFFADIFKSFDKKNTRNDDFLNNDKNIPTMYQCKKCGTYYAEMPKDRKCSCGEILD